MHQIANDWRTSNNWPYPYVCPDRAAALEPYGVMIQNAWQRQTLLGDHHFKPKTGELNAPGEKMVRWIADEAPAGHRAIYVRRGETAEETAARMVSVRQMVARISPESSSVPVVESSARPLGYPSGWPTAKDTTISPKWPISVPTNIYLPHTENRNK